MSRHTTFRDGSNVSHSFAESFPSQNTNNKGKKKRAAEKGKKNLATEEVKGINGKSKSRVL